MIVRERTTKSWSGWLRAWWPRSPLEQAITGTAAVLATVALAAGWALWRQNLADIESVERTRVEALAASAALHIDGRVHEEWSRAYPTQDGLRDWDDASPDLQETRNLLIRTHRAARLPTPAYTMRLRDEFRDAVRERPDRQIPEAMEFIVTTADRPYWKHRYEYRPEMAPTLLHGRVVSTSAYEDRHGSWISAYAPIRDETGRIYAILEVDAPITVASNAKMIVSGGVIEAGDDLFLSGSSSRLEISGGEVNGSGLQVSQSADVVLSGGSTDLGTDLIESSTLTVHGGTHNGGSVTVLSGSVFALYGGTYRTSSISGDSTADIQIHGGTLNVTGFSGLTVGPANGFNTPITLPEGSAINVSDFLTLDPASDVTLDGGTVSALFTLADGNLQVLRGAVRSNVQSSGTIHLGHLTQARVEGTLTNLGTLTGTGRVTNSLLNQVGGEVFIDIAQQIVGVEDPAIGPGVFNSGVITLNNGTLRAVGSFENIAGGLVIGNGAVRTSTGLTNAAGAQMAFSGPTNIFGPITNQGLIVSTGGGPLTFFNDVTQLGEVRTSEGSFTVFFGNVDMSSNFTGGGGVVFESGVNPGSSPGVVGFGGDVSFGPAALVRIETRAPAPIDATAVPGVDHDQLDITGQVTLDGTLDVALLNPGTRPLLGTEFQVMLFADRGGSMFSDIQGTLIDTDYALAPLFTDTNLVIRASIPGDLNLDNRVSVADLSAFALNFNTAPGFHDEAMGLSSWQLGDFNGDGVVGVSDLSLLALNFGFDLGAGDPATGLSLEEAARLAGIDVALVPEPGAVAVTVFGVFGMVGCRRCWRSA